MSEGRGSWSCGGRFSTIRIQCSFGEGIFYDLLQNINGKNAKIVSSLSYELMAISKMGSNYKVKYLNDKVKFFNSFCERCPMFLKHISVT